MVHRRKQPIWLCNDAKVTLKEFEFIATTTLDVILNTPDDSGHGYYIVCDIENTNECKERTEQLALMPNKRKIRLQRKRWRQGKIREINLRPKQQNRIYGSL